MPPRRHALPLARENRSVLRNTELDAAPMLKTFAHLDGCTWLGQGSGDPALGPCTLIARYGFTGIRNHGYGLGTSLLMFDNSNAGRCRQAIHHRHAQVHQDQRMYVLRRGGPLPSHRTPIQGGFPSEKAACKTASVETGNRQRRGCASPSSGRYQCLMDGNLESSHRQKKPAPAPRNEFAWARMKVGCTSSAGWVSSWVNCVQCSGLGFVRWPT